jgi:signal transduction histidine kinase
MVGHLKQIFSQGWNWRHFAAFSVLVVCIIAFASSGKMHAVNNSFTDLRFRLLQKAPSGDAVIVAIDSKSLQALRDWPWPRSYHGDLVTALDKAGAKQIAFDIDFSSPGIAQDNQHFAAAIASAEADVFLASFQQSISQDLPDVIAEMLPTPVLQAPASLASVNYMPEEDGKVRQGAYGHPFSFGVVPSIASALTDKPADTSAFYVNFAIDIDRIQHISYSDILSGNFDPADIAGKTVFVGATAVELGDEYALPVYGVRSGVGLNVLAYESLHQDAALQPVPMWVSWLVALLLASVIALLYRKMTIVIALSAVFVSMAGVFSGSMLLQGQFNLIPATAPVFTTIALFAVYLSYLELHERGRNLFRARMEIRQNYSLLDALVSENHEGVLTVNYQGHIQMCNDRAAYLLGLDKASIAGKELAEVRPDMAELLALNDEQQGVVARHQIETRLEEETRFVDLTVSRVCIAPVKSVYERRTEPRLTTLFALHDITAQKQAELTERRAKEALAQTVEAKSLLISTMSHELRTPLNAIIGFSQLYQQEAFGPLGASEYTEYAGMINDSGHQLLSVVNDMLLSGKIQSGELEMAPQQTCCRDLIEAAEVKAQERPAWEHQTILHNVAPEITDVMLDQEFMQTALVHLLDNAAKFAGPDGQITIRAMKQDHDLVLEVADNGPGADVEDLSSLKQMLKQGDSSLNRQGEGCGLGLFIVDQITRLHGGQLDLSSSEEGFTARMTFPKACKSEGTAEAA